MNQSAFFIQKLIKVTLVTCVILLALNDRHVLAMERYAIIASNSMYPESLGGPLVTPFNDGARIQQQLDKLGWTTEHLVDFKASDFLDQIDDMVESWFSIEPNGPPRLLLFYYAGHGFSHGGHNVILPVDASVPDADQPHLPELRVIPLVDVVDRLAPHVRLPERPGGMADIVLLVIDACRNLPASIGTSSFRDDAWIDPRTGLVYSTHYGGFAANWSNDNRNLDSLSLFSDVFVATLDQVGVNAETLLRGVQLIVSDRAQSFGKGQTPILQIGAEFSGVRFGTMTDENDFIKGTRFKICTEYNMTLRPLNFHSSSVQAWPNQLLLNESQILFAVNYCKKYQSIEINCKEFGFRHSTYCEEFTELLDRNCDNMIFQAPDYSGWHLHYTSGPIGDGFIYN